MDVNEIKHLKESKCFSKSILKIDSIILRNPVKGSLEG